MLQITNEGTKFCRETLPTLEAFADQLGRRDKCVGSLR